TPNCPVCPAGTNTAYWARYYTREAANPVVRPKLVVTYATATPVAANVTLTAPPTTTAGAGTVKLADVPPAALLQPQSSAESTPVNETTVNETPVNETPVNELPVNELPVNEIRANETRPNEIGLDFVALSGSVPALGGITLNSIPLLRPGG